ncbi:MAG TPA: potassium-transporting ATPase subunit KdpC [Pirellulales bacterium]|jgi:K+-transporting ATPase ATPase C chain
MFRHIRAAIVIFVALTLVTGVAYPLVVTGIGQTLFPRQAQGSFVERDGVVLGSELIGQQFEGPEYFWGRLSATGPMPYNAAASSGSNLGPTNPALVDAVKARIAALQTADPENTAKIPVDLVTSSGSGLDPHISPAAAEYQLARVAKARKLAPQEVRSLVAKHTAGRSLGMLGEARVNVLLVNLDLDKVTADKTGGL